MKEMLMNAKERIEGKFLAFIAPAYVMVSQTMYAIADEQAQNSALVSRANSATTTLYNDVKSISGGLVIATVAVALLFSLVPGAGEDGIKKSRTAAKAAVVAWLVIMLAPVIKDWVTDLLALGA